MNTHEKEYRVTLSSDAYGDEDFEYDSLGELVMSIIGHNGLLIAAQREFKQDGIERKITIHIE